MVSFLTGRLLLFLQVDLHFDEVCLERSPGPFLLQLGFPGLVVFLELPRFRKEAAGNADDFSFHDGFDGRGCLVNALFQSCVKALEGIVSIIGLPDPLFLLGQVCGQYTSIVSIEVAQ